MLACIMSICGFAQNSNEQDLLKEANLGNSEAQYKMGKCLDDKKEYTQAFEWYSKAAAQGFAPAECIIGYYYDNGMGVEKNTAKAFEWWSKAAAQGFAKAEYNVGTCYENGIGVEKNTAKAFEWYSKAAAQGYASAECAIGYYYENGMGVEKNASKAFEWYSKAAAQGFAQAEYKVGICYEHGMGVEWNRRKARKWMNKAAEDGSLDAQIESINKYSDLKDVRDGFKRRIREMRKGMVMKYILLACKQGHEKSKNMFEEYIGMPYENLGNTYKSQIKTYMGEYLIDTPDWYVSGNCTYQYYEIGGLRIYHGVFEFKSNKTYRTKAGQTIPMLTIKGYFKDDFRDGTWKIRRRVYGSGIEEIDATYQDGVFNGPFVYTIKDESNVFKSQINARYKDGFIVGTYTARALDGTFIKASLDEDELLHGNLSCEDKKQKIEITGDFIHGKSNNCFIKNLQTGSFERCTSASELISTPWTKYNSIMWNLTKFFIRGVGYIPINAADDKF